jgi:copper chaperone
MATSSIRCIAHTGIASIEATMIELQLPTMTCNHCVRTVNQTVQRVDAHAKVEVDLPTKTVRIDSQRERAEFVRALSDEGYQPA